MNRLLWLVVLIFASVLASGGEACSPVAHDWQPTSITTDKGRHRQIAYDGINRFGGKEREHAGGIDIYDFGARSLCPYGSWSTPDPMAERFYGLSPYSYCGGDPINRIDREGEFWETLWDVGNVIYDVGAAIYSHATGDHETAKEHWVDAGWDVVAAAVPLVPAGASKIGKAAKAIDKGAEINSYSKTGKQVINGGVRKIEPNYGVAKPHGGKEHNERIDKMIEVLKKNDNVSNIRKNQKQVDKDGYTVGNNRPDIQFDKDNIHTNIEYDTQNSSMNRHKEILPENDPNARNKFYKVKK